MLATYGDKLLETSTTGRVRAETAELAEILFRLAGAWVDRARRLTADPVPDAASAMPEPLPEWHTAIRTQSLRERLAAIDAKLETVDGLWIARAPAELRGGIGRELALLPQADHEN